MTLFRVQEGGEIKRCVNAGLQNLDKRREIGFTIGITNHPKRLDPAVWRRFEMQLEIPKPGFEMRKALAAHFMPPVDAPDTHVRLIAWFTEGATGAEIESLVRTYKKASTIRAEGRPDLLNNLRQFATLNSARTESERSALLFRDATPLFRAISYNPLIGLPIRH